MATPYLNVVMLKMNFRLGMTEFNGFGVLGVACWPLVPKFAGSNPAEDVGFLGRKNPQHAFLRQSHVVDLRHVKDP